MRLQAENRYAIYFGCWDEEDEFFEISKTFTEEKKDVLPKQLQKAMEKYGQMRKSCACPVIFYRDKTCIAKVSHSPPSFFPTGGCSYTSGDFYIFSLQVGVAAHLQGITVGENTTDRDNLF